METLTFLRPDGQDELMMTSPDTWIFSSEYSETFHWLFPFLWIINESFVHFGGNFRLSRVVGLVGQLWPHQQSVRLLPPFGYVFHQRWWSAPLCSCCFSPGPRCYRSALASTLLSFFSFFSQRQHFVKEPAWRITRQQPAQNNRSLTQSFCLLQIVFTLLPFPVLVNIHLFIKWISTIQIDRWLKIASLN